MPPAGTGETRRLGEVELTHLIRGASILGTGGGGSFSIARALVADLSARGMTVELSTLDRLRPDALGLSTAILGGGLTHAELEGMGMLSEDPASCRGAKALASYLVRPVDFVFAAELGPQNTMEAIRLAAFLGVPVVDGDCAGRAMPEMQQSTLPLCGIPLTPFTVTTFQGDAAIFTHAASDARIETLCRALAVASGGVVCLTGFPAEARRLRLALIPGTLGVCMEIGRAGRVSPSVLAGMLKGRLAFQGRVLGLDVRCEGGFFRGDLALAGTGAFGGQSYRIGIQNEFLWSWKDGSLDVQCPDLICVINSETGLGKVTYGHGFENAIEMGEALTVLHVPCAEVWRTERGRILFPPPPSIR